MYTINQSTTVDTGSSASPIPVGINENVKFMGLEKKADKNGKPYLSFMFQDSDGNSLMHNEFEVNPQYVTPKEGETTEDAVNRRVNSMLVRIKHICTQFISTEQFVVTGNSLEEFCTNLVALMANKDYSKLLKLKVVYNYRDYNSLPNFTPFVEAQDKQPSSLKISPKYDKMEIAAKEATAEVASSTEDVLPF